MKYIYIYICMYGYNVIHRPAPVFSSILNVHVSEMLCTFHVVHVSQQLCTFHSSCARFKSPLITFWSDQTPSTDICIYIYIIFLFYRYMHMYVYIYIYISMVLRGTCMYFWYRRNRSTSFFGNVHINIEVWGTQKKYALLSHLPNQTTRRKPLIQSNHLRCGLCLIYGFYMNINIYIYI